MKAIDDILQQEGYPDLVMLQVCAAHKHCFAGCLSLQHCCPAAHFARNRPTCMCGVCMWLQEVTHNIVALFEQMGWFRLYHCSPVPQQVCQGRCMGTLVIA